MHAVVRFRPPHGLTFVLLWIVGVGALHLPELKRHQRLYDFRRAHALALVHQVRNQLRCLQCYAPAHVLRQELADSAAAALPHLQKQTWAGKLIVRCSCGFPSTNAMRGF